jgi:hypothetical protein
MKPIISLTVFLGVTLICLLGHGQMVSATPLSANTYTRGDGALMVSGQPTFAIGMYHVSSLGSDEDRRAALQSMATVGFNLMHCPIDSNDTAFLDEAARRGVYIQAEFNDDWQTVVNAYKNHAAIIGWDIADDAELNFTPAQLQSLHNAVKALDPNHATFIGTSDPDKFGPYIVIPDIANVYSYPVPEFPINVVDQVLTKASSYYHPIWGVPQAFAWRGERAPTPVELRNMTYQMLINGVKGLVYYTYFDGSWNIRDYPNLWAELIALISEVKTLEPAYLNGTRTKINDTGATEVVAAKWNYEDRIYLVIINTSANQSKNVSIDLPTAAEGSLQPVFQNRPRGMVFVDGVVRGSIGPLEVHVYQFKRGPTIIYVPILFGVFMAAALLVWMGRHQAGQLWRSLKISHTHHPVLIS